MNEPARADDLIADADADALFAEDEATFTDRPSRQRRQVSDPELERMYDQSSFRIITQRNDFLIPNLLQSMEQQQYLNLNPPYQRRLRWTTIQKSKLIESLLMNVPIPPIFLFEVNLAQYEVVDGQQRLSSIREFFNNEFSLTGLERWSSLNGRRFARLPRRIQAGLLRRSLSAVIMLAESGGQSDFPQDRLQQEIKQFVFERLNTGGVRLNHQEIRNALYDGPFNHLLHELSRNPTFTTTWDIPHHTEKDEANPSDELRKNRIYQTMLDCEIVLRFFTLQDLDSLSASMKSSLDNTMERLASSSAEDIDRMRSDYIYCLETACSIFRKNTFRLIAAPGGTGRVGALSRALYDAVMLGIFSVARNLADQERANLADLYSRKRDVIMTMTGLLLSQEDNYALLVGRLNTRKSIVDRIVLMEAIFSEIASPE